MFKKIYNWTKEKISQAWIWTKKQGKKILLLLGIGAVIAAGELILNPDQIVPPIEPPIENPDFAIQVSIEKKYNQKYSLKDFTGRTLKDAEDLKDMIVYASCFSQETPDSHIFPENMKDITFVNCNLDNVYIPAGNTIVGGSQRRFKVQNDKMNWFVDKNNNPIEPLDKEIYLKAGLSIDPKDLPAQVMKESIILKEMDKLK